ncbi:MAG: glycosyltransferase family 2 protein, partial [Oscillospiraceae bacterium]|nr:glycosyltransferase family 2 protein [Oscillospiraceae bacterium]
MNDRNAETVIINTDSLFPPSTASDMWGNRKKAYFAYEQPGVPLCSIVVQSYNRLNKTKYCVECILNYSKDVDYELILVDNGSTDGTFEFFQSVLHEKKKIIRVTKNMGAAFPLPHIRTHASGKYIVLVNNDIYVTKNWLSNLLKCYESDPRIGFAEPVSSNVSNSQQVDMPFDNFVEMQKKAAKFNNSDPSKWDERLRLISLLNIMRRDVLDIVGTYDPAFVHDFAEDDLAIRLRRAGYKLVLCGDTWIHHDHDFR